MYRDIFDTINELYEEWERLETLGANTEQIEYIKQRIDELELVTATI